MNPRQARRERREAERKAKKLELKKSRLAETHPLAAPEQFPEIQPRWNPELEDEFPREVQIRSNAIRDLRDLQAGRSIPPPGPTPGPRSDATLEEFHEYYVAKRKAAVANPQPLAETGAAAFASQTQAEPTVPMPNQEELPLRNSDHPQRKLRASAMSTPAQITANQQNAKFSCGPRTPQGKAISSQNNFRHGFTGAFCILDWEKAEEYQFLYDALIDDHSPDNTTEHVLVKTMAQSYWLRERALNLQEICFDPARPMCQEIFEKQLALYLRYQTTHDRAFNKALDQLTKLRAGKRKSEIGFESHQRKETEQKLKEECRQAREKRQEAAEHRAGELHQARVWLIESQTRRHETETTIAKFFKMPHTTGETPEPAAKEAA